MDKRESELFRMPSLLRHLFTFNQMSGVTFRLLTHGGNKRIWRLLGYQVWESDAAGKGSSTDFNRTSGRRGWISEFDLKCKHKDNVFFWPQQSFGSCSSTSSAWCQRLFPLAQQEVGATLELFFPAKTKRYGSRFGTNQLWNLLDGKEATNGENWHCFS